MAESEIYGLGGDDHLSSHFAGATYLYGGPGNDWLSKVEGYAGGAFIYGEEGNDELYGGWHGDRIYGGTGSDLAYGLGYGDLLDGGDGNDGLHGGDGNDALYGGEGDDTHTGIPGYSAGGLYGDFGYDYLDGGRGDDYLDGGGWDDRLVGGEGSDVLIGGGGADRMSGGEGSDRFYVDDPLDLVIEAADDGSDTIYASTSYTLRAYQSVEGLRAESETATTAMTLIGNELGQYVVGNDGINVLIGNAGSDRIFGLSGADTLDGGLGSDRLSGGLGSDQAVYASATMGVVADLQTSAANTGDAAGDIFFDIENLFGSAFGDTLRGNSYANYLKGEAGSDTLVGRLGRDVLAGGLANDIFLYNGVTDSGTTEATRDVITDFVKGQDKINLSAIDAIAATAANDAFVLLAKGTSVSAVGTGHVGWYWLDYAEVVNDKTILRINNDGDATIEMTIELRGLITLAASDFNL
jgi:Ca2+-binding RTX toxin-like protein